MGLANKCLAINGGVLGEDNVNEAMRDDNFTTEAVVVPQTNVVGVARTMTITFPLSIIKRVMFRASSSPSTSSGYSYFYVYLYYSSGWQLVWQSGQVATWNPGTITVDGLWSDVIGMQCYSITAPTGGAYSQMSWYEMQAYTYVGKNFGFVMI